FAFKVSGHILRANDWSIADDPKEDTARKNAQQALQVLRLISSMPDAGSQSEMDSLSRIGNRDSLVEVYSVDARTDAILGDNSTANVSAGLTRIVNQIALTEDFGGAQIKNWQYEYLLGHVNYGDLFVQGAINHNDTKDSYFLTTGAPIIDRSTTYNAQIQDEYDSIEHEKLTYGADFNAIHPVTDGTLYGPDDGHANISIFGAYLQSQTSLFDNALDLVLAGRLDKHNYLTNPIFSPRAAAVYHFASDQLVRAMYNVTYLFPSVTDLYADILFASDPFGFNALGLGAGPNIRYVAPYVSGLHFTANTDGSYNMYSTLAPGNAIASNNAVTALWPKLDSLAQFALNAKHVSADSLAAYLLGTVPAPRSQQVKTYLAYLNLHPNANLSNAFLPAPNGQPLDISPVQAQHQRTLEVDYQGEFEKAVQFEVDAYQTHYTAIRASTVALTPNVFADGTSLRQYLIDSLTPRLGPANATALADSLSGQLASLPLGVVQASGGAPSDAHPYDVFIGTRGYLENAITFYGVDLFTTIKANDDWTFDGSFSWLNKIYWYASELNSTSDSTQQSPFSLNMPKYRFSVGAKYSGLANGLSVELRDRWSDAFQMNDNYYIGDVGARHVLDLTVDYHVASGDPTSAWNNLLLTLSVTNLLNNYHQDFIGAPFIGRLAVLRAAYTLPPL
ncbi:MAG: TonB-dependent receptor domain-containing protein, partial [Candidatus Kapaibacterium sp.]